MAQPGAREKALGRIRDAEITGVGDMMRVQIILDLTALILCFVFHDRGIDMSWWVLPAWIFIALMAHLEALKK